MQWSGPPLHRDTTPNLFSTLVVTGELLWDARKRLFEIKRIRGDRAQPLYCVSAFFDDLPHQLLDLVQPRLGRRVLMQLLDRDVELHGGAEEALQQCVM